MDEKEEILNFWFTECNPEQWFKKVKSFDQTIENRFSNALEDAIGVRWTAGKKLKQDVLL